MTSRTVDIARIVIDTLNDAAVADSDIKNIFSPDATQQHLIEQIILRRSVSPKRLGMPAPSRCEILQMVQAAARAPDHARLQPCRFLEIPHASRETLAKLFIAAKCRTRSEHNAINVERESEKATGAPTLIAVYARLQPNHPRVTVSEQLVAVGAAVQNFMLVAHALDYGAIILSGDRIRIPQLKQTLGLQKSDKLIGFISVGTVTNAKISAPESACEEIYDVWDSLTDCTTLN